MYTRPAHKYGCQTWDVGALAAFLYIAQEPGPLSAAHFGFHHLVPVTALPALIVIRLENLTTNLPRPCSFFPFPFLRQLRIDLLYWIYPRALGYVLILNSSGSLSNRLYQENPPDYAYPMNDSSRLNRDQ